MPLKMMIEHFSCYCGRLRISKHCEIGELFATNMVMESYVFDPLLKIICKRNIIAPFVFDGINSTDVYILGYYCIVACFGSLHITIYIAY